MSSSRRLLPLVSRRRLSVAAALGLLLAAGCGGAGDNAPFFKNAFADAPVKQTLQMTHGFTLYLVDEVPSRPDTTFSLQLSAGEPVSWMLTDGRYQDSAPRPRVEVNGSPADMSEGVLSGKELAARFSIQVHKVAGQESASSHQVRLDVFSTHPLDSAVVTPVEVEVSGPPGARWEILEHEGRVAAAP